MNATITRAFFPIPVLAVAEAEHFRSRVEDLAQRLGGRPKPMGPNVLIHSVSIFSKHAHTPDYVSWHQDGYY